MEIKAPGWWMQLLTDPAPLATPEAFQKYWREGMAEERRREAASWLLIRGNLRFGTLDVARTEALEALPAGRLQELTDRLLEVASWDELLAE